MSDAPSIVCTNCLKDGQFVDAVKYCVNCNENMCKPCLRQHIKAHTGSAHKLIGRDEIPDWMRPPVGNNEDEGERFCMRHPDKEMDKYCEDHEVLCCEDCGSMEHSLCETVVTLKDAISHQEAKGAHATHLQQLRLLSKDLQKERKLCHQIQTRIRKSTATSLTAVRTIKQRAIKLFEELEKTAIDEINSDCIDKDDHLQTDIASLDETNTLIDICMKQLEIGSDSNLQMILQLQRSKRIQSGGKELLDKIRSGEDVCSHEFTVNPNIETFLGKLTSIGNFALVKKKDLTLRPNKDINVHLSTDMVQCNIQSITNMSDGILYLTDCENENLKCLRSSLDLDEEYWLQLCSAPYSVCSVGQHEVAVSLPSIKQVQYLSLGADIVIEGCIQVGEYCRGLAYSHLYDELYVSCGGGSMPGEGLGQIQVYRKSELLRSFKVCQNGKPICSQPAHLAVSNDGTLIHVADSVRGVITLDRQGTVLSTLALQELEAACGICVDIDGNVIVCGHKSNNVIRARPTGADYKVLLGVESGILHPTDVCYDVRSSMLFVTNGLNDDLKSFHVK